MSNRFGSDEQGVPLNPSEQNTYRRSESRNFNTKDGYLSFGAENFHHQYQSRPIAAEAMTEIEEIIKNDCSARNFLSPALANSSE